MGGKTVPGIDGLCIGGEDNMKLIRLRKTAPSTGITIPLIEYFLSAIECRAELLACGAWDRASGRDQVACSRFRSGDWTSTHGTVQSTVS
jgi:hypothetical protein